MFNLIHTATGDCIAQVDIDANEAIRRNIEFSYYHLPYQLIEPIPTTENPAV